MKDYNDFLTEGRIGPRMVVSAVFDDRMRIVAAFLYLEEACSFFAERWNGREGWVLTTMGIEAARQVVNPAGMAVLAEEGMVLMADGDYMNRRGMLNVPFAR